MSNIFCRIFGHCWTCWILIRGSARPDGFCRRCGVSAWSNYLPDGFIGVELTTPFRQWPDDQEGETND